GAAGPRLHWLQACVALLALVLVVGGLLRQAGAAGEPIVAGQGVWKVLGGAAFLSPIGLAADRFGNLYVVDAASFHIYKLAPDGTLLATFGTRGSAPGQFDRPTAMAPYTWPTTPTIASRSSRRAGRRWPNGARTARAPASSTTRARWSSTYMATCSSRTASTIASRSSLRPGCRWRNGVVEVAKQA